MVQSFHASRRKRYGPGSSRQRHNHGGDRQARSLARRSALTRRRSRSGHGVAPSPILRQGRKEPRSTLLSSVCRSRESRKRSSSSGLVGTIIEQTRGSPLFQTISVRSSVSPSNPVALGSPL